VPPPAQVTASLNATSASAAIDLAAVPRTSKCAIV